MSRTTRNRPSYLLYVNMDPLTASTLTNNRDSHRGTSFLYLANGDTDVCGSNSRPFYKKVQTRRMRARYKRDIKELIDDRGAD